MSLEHKIEALTKALEANTAMLAGQAVYSNPKGKGNPAATAAKGTAKSVVAGAMQDVKKDATAKRLSAAELRKGLRKELVAIAKELGAEKAASVIEHFKVITAPDIPDERLQEAFDLAVQIHAGG